MEYSICAVVVTYNRKELLVRNIRSLLSQTIGMHILIIDNASTDGTYEYLIKEHILDEKCVSYKRTEKNLGGSGGFCFGEKEAVKTNYDYIWLMDDDGYCLNEKTLEELIKRIDSGKKQILNSYVLCDYENKVPTFGLGEYKTDSDVRKASSNGILIGKGNAYNGTLVPRNCFLEVGYTDERFFIYGDEADFFYRTNLAGYDWITPIESYYYHPVNRNIKKYNLFGFGYEVKDQPIWKLYLETRNVRYLGIKYYHTRTSIKHYVKAFLIAIRSKDKRIKRVYYSFLGLRDANKEYFEREIMFNA